MVCWPTEFIVAILIKVYDRVGSQQEPEYPSTLGEAQRQGLTMERLHCRQVYAPQLYLCMSNDKSATGPSV